MRLIGKKKREGEEAERKREQKRGKKDMETGRRKFSEQKTQRREEEITRDRKSLWDFSSGQKFGPKKTNMFHNVANLVWVHMNTCGLRTELMHLELQEKDGGGAKRGNRDKIRVLNREHVPER